MQRFDCDIHPTLTSTSLLLPYLDPFWAEQIVSRGIDGLELNSYPASMPLSARPDWQREGNAPASRLDYVQADVFDKLGATGAICNVMHGALAVHDPYLGSALCAAINDWVAKEWLDREPRLSASLLVSTQDISLAVKEVERWASDKRFVQILMLVTGDALLGESRFLPLFKAAEKHGFAIGLHAGSKYRWAPTSAGWPSYRYEFYVCEAQSFQSQVLSLIYNGVFQECPNIKVVLMESGVSWIPSLMWRADKTWRGLRVEVPWVDEPPSRLIRKHVRVTTQPLDAPDAAEEFQRLMDQIGSDEMFLHSSDYPHWQFDGTDCYPPQLSSTMRDYISERNPLRTYARLRGGSK